MIHDLYGKKFMSRHGFTLIELSIVLVIIGLIVGGVLVGRDLINAAEVRAQVSQIERLNQAVNAFRGKYDNFLPGDMNVPTATKYGFTIGTNCDGSSEGWRNGNGIVEGWSSSIPLVQGAGETGLFWQDLSTSKLIAETFPAAGAGAPGCVGAAGLALTLTPGTQYLGTLFPIAKIATNNFIYIYPYNGINWFGLSAVQSTNTSGGMVSGANIPVIQAYNLDKKVDDGIPTTGTVRALYINSVYTVPQNPPNNSIAGGNAGTCYDTTTNTYSITQNNGSGPNCALSFKIQ